MGGLGSGRPWHYDARPSTRDFLRLDVRRLHRAGFLRPGAVGTNTWRRGDTRTADIGFRVEGADDRAEVLRLVYTVNGDPVDLPVTLSWTPCNFGGTRPWALCPRCGRRVAVLYGGRRFACRYCHGLAYASTRDDAMTRNMTKAHRIRERLGAAPTDRFPPKPKGMHWRTYWRLVGDANEAEAMGLQGMLMRLERLAIFGGQRGSSGRKNTRP